MNWRQYASCLDHDSELFFPIGDTDPALAQLAAAQAVCANCPVRRSCLDWAIMHSIDHGVWGGISEVQRRTRNRQQQPARTPVTARRGS